MSWKVYITSKVDQKENCIATCDYSDDADLLFDSYVLHKYSVRVTYDNGWEGKEEMHKEHKEPS